MLSSVSITGPLDASFPLSRHAQPSIREGRQAGSLMDQLLLLPWRLYLNDATKLSARYYLLRWNLGI